MDQQLSDPAKLQLTVRNFVQKTVELILFSRLRPLPPEMPRGKPNRWVRRGLLRAPLHRPPRVTRLSPPPQFNIDSESLPTVHSQLQAFREDISQPLQLDIFVDTSQLPPSHPLLGVLDAAPSSPVVLLERWRLAYEPQSAPPTNISWPGFYKARSARNSSARNSSAQILQR